MRQKRYRWSLLVLMTAMLLFGTMAVQASETEKQPETQPETQQTGPAEIARAKCGLTATGVLTADGVLTVTGSGKVDDCKTTQSWFYSYRNQITKIVIGSGITKIGEYAFEGTACRELVIGPDVEAIRTRAFWKSPYLQSVTIPDKVRRIGPGAFRESGVASCVLGKGLETIGDYAFYKTPLASVAIPESVKTIGQRAFLDTPLTNVTIPRNVTTIRTHAFGSVNAIIYSPNVAFEANAFGSGSALTVLEGSATEINAKNRGFTVNCFECRLADGTPLPKHDSLDAGRVTKEPTCTAQGEKTYTCSRCGKTVVEYLPMVPHTYGEWTVVSQATISEKGLRSRLCTVCRHMEVEDLAKVQPTLALNSDQVVLNAGGSYKLKVTVKSPGDYVAKWTSSNKKVATVTSGGKIKAKAPGKTTIKVKMDSGLSAKVKVTVQKAGTTSLKVSAKGAKLTGKKVTVKAKKSFTLVAKVKPSNSTDKVKFSSSNKKVATVSFSGKVTAKKKGRTKITVKSGKIKTTITVTVK